MVKGLMLAAALALGLVGGAQAQQNRAALNHYNDTNFFPNTTGYITPYIANVMHNSIIASMCVQSDTNTFTGSNSFTGPLSFVSSSLPSVQRGDPIPATGQEYINSSGFPVFAQ